jgi:hypothetical protein
MELFRFALEEKIQLVPILLQYEAEYYHILQWPKVQNWMQAHLGYPWPQGAWPRRGGRREMEQVFGAILHCTDRFANAEELSQAFGEGIRRLSCSELEEEECKIEFIL